MQITPQNRLHYGIVQVENEFPPKLRARGKGLRTLHTYSCAGECERNSQWDERQREVCIPTSVPFTVSAKNSPLFITQCSNGPESALI